MQRRPSGRTDALPWRPGTRGGDTIRRRAAAFLRQYLITSALALWINAGLSAAGGFIFWTLAARVYSPEAVGLGSATLAAIMLVATVSHLGLGAGFVRFAPEARGRAHLLLATALGVASITAAIAAGTFLVGLPVWSPALAYLRGWPVAAAGFTLLAVLATLTVIQDQVLIAVHRAGFLYFKVPLTFLVRIVLLWLLASRDGAFAIVAASGLASAVGLFAGLAAVRRALSSDRAALHSRLPPATFLPYALGNHVADLTLAAPGLILPLMVVNRLGSEQAAFFYVGWFLGQLLLVGGFSLGFSLFTEGSSDQSRLASLSRQALILAGVVVSAGAVLLILLADRLLLAFGASYARAAATLVRSVAVASLPGAVVHLYLSVQRVRRDMGALITVAAVAALVNLSLSYVLLPRMGIAGAGVGLLVGYTVAAGVVAARFLRGSPRTRMGLLFGHGVVRDDCGRPVGQTDGSVEPVRPMRLPS